MQDGSCSSSSGKVWVKFASKAKPELKRAQIRYNRTTAKPPHNLLAKNKSTNQCLIGWRKGPWMLTEGTLTISLFYYMQLTCALCSMKKSHVSHDDSSGSKKNGFFSFLLVNIFSNTPTFQYFSSKLRNQSHLVPQIILQKGKRKPEEKLEGNQVKLLPSVHDWNPEPPTVLVEDVRICVFVFLLQNRQEKMHKNGWNLSLDTELLETSWPNQLQIWSPQRQPLRA